MGWLRLWEKMVEVVEGVEKGKGGVGERVMEVMMEELFRRKDPLREKKGGMKEVVGGGKEKTY